MYHGSLDNERFLQRKLAAARCTVPQQSCDHSMPTCLSSEMRETKTFCPRLMCSSERVAMDRLSLVFLFIPFAGPSSRAYSNLEFVIPLILRPAVHRCYIPLQAQVLHTVAGTVLHTVATYHLLHTVAVTVLHTVAGRVVHIVATYHLLHTVAACHNQQSLLSTAPVLRRGSTAAAPLVAVTCHTHHVTSCHTHHVTHKSCHTHIMTLIILAWILPFFRGL